jgi:hypothetical protein
VEITARLGVVHLIEPDDGGLSDSLVARYAQCVERAVHYRSREIGGARKIVEPEPRSEARLDPLRRGAATFQRVAVEAERARADGGDVKQPARI